VRQDETEDCELDAGGEKEGLKMGRSVHIRLLGPRGLRGWAEQPIERRDSIMFSQGAEL
jgi:hypothetical protein